MRGIHAPRFNRDYFRFLYSVLVAVTVLLQSNHVDFLFADALWGRHARIKTSIDARKSLWWCTGGISVSIDFRRLSRIDGKCFFLLVLYFYRYFHPSASFTRSFTCVYRAATPPGRGWSLGARHVDCMQIHSFTWRVICLLASSSVGENGRRSKVEISSWELRPWNTRKIAAVLLRYSYTLKKKTTGQLREP